MYCVVVDVVVVVVVIAMKVWEGSGSDVGRRASGRKVQRG